MLYEAWKTTRLLHGNQHKLRTGNENCNLHHAMEWCSLIFMYMYFLLRFFAYIYIYIYIYLYFLYIINLIIFKAKENSSHVVMVNSLETNCTSHHTMS